MAFNEIRKANFYANILDINRFGELVTIKEPSRDEREIAAKITNMSAVERQPYHEDDQEILKVAVGRDPAHAKGGILSPLRGTTLKRTGIGEDRLFVFGGRIHESTPYSWLLEFTRNVPEMIGTPAR